eukprot:2071824-Prymnesium_polylepis.2
MCDVKADFARVVAPHAVPGPHDGARVPAAAARGGAQHLPAGGLELHTAQGTRCGQGLLSTAARTIWGRGSSQMSSGRGL